MSQKQNFLSGPILSSLLRFAGPVFLALCLQAAYGAVDLLVVGRFGTAADMSAVSTGSQILHTITIVVTSFAMGVTVLIAQRIGEGKGQDAGKVIGASICLFAVIGLLVTLLQVSAAEGLSALMKAPAEAFAKTAQYVRICGAGSLFIVAYNLLGSVFRGMGDSKTPLLSVAIACVANIIGDLLLVGVFDMGAAGAAIATVVAQGISVVLCLFVIRRRGLPFPFERRFIRWDGAILGRVVGLGTPIALQELLVGISFLVILTIVNGLGLAPSAGVGVAQKLCSFIMLVPSAFSQSLSAFAGQNMGARKPNRAQKAMALGMGASFLCGILMATVVFLFGVELSHIFTDDPAVARASADYLQAYAVDTLFVAFLFCYIGFFNGCGKTRFVMIQGIVGAFGVRIPVSYFLSKIQPVSLYRVGLATPASTLVQIALCTGYLIYLRKSFPAIDQE